MTATLERIPKTSPLLRGAVIERDYTKGIETQLSGGGQQADPKPQPEAQPQAPVQEPIKAETQIPEPEPSQPTDSSFDSPKGFSFDEEITDQSDATEEDTAGFELASGSAKTFANVIGDLIRIKVPEFSFNYCKVDTNSIEVHIQNGNINVALREAFQNINTLTRENLEFSDDEIKMWKKAFKEYLEYKNIKTANPETAFWIATGTLVLTQGIKVRELKKNNKQYIVDAINSYNPQYFESFKAKKNEAPEKKEEAETKKTTEKTLV